MLRKKDSYRKEADYICVSQSTLDSIETSQDDEARIDLTRLESWHYLLFFNDSCSHECIFCSILLIDWIVESASSAICLNIEYKNHQLPSERS